MRKFVATVALLLTVLAVHAEVYSIKPSGLPPNHKTILTTPNGEFHIGVPYYRYSYVQNGFVITTDWAPLTRPEQPISLVSGATFTRIEVQRFHALTGNPEGPLFVLL